MIKHPDDAAGIGFARQLAVLRARVSKRCSQPVTIERLEWSMDWVEPCCEIAKSISALSAGYYLTTFELKESFLETQGDDAPRISWVVYKGRGYRPWSWVAKRPRCSSGRLGPRRSGGSMPACDRTPDAIRREDDFGQNLIPDRGGDRLDLP